MVQLSDSACLCVCVCAAMFILVTHNSYTPGYTGNHKPEAQAVVTRAQQGHYYGPRLQNAPKMSKHEKASRSTCTRGSSFFLGKVTALGVLCCFALFVCLTLLASFFLPSHLSFRIYM